MAVQSFVQKYLTTPLLVLLTAVGLSVGSHQVYAAPQRVISLAPHTTELAYAAGMGETLIAASDYSDYPPEANKLEKVASWQGINLERVLALKPDLILAWRGGNPQKVLDQLSGFGISLFYSDPQTIQEIADNLNQLAAYSSKPEIAHQAAAKLLADRLALEKRYQRKGEPVRVFLQFSNQPLFTASGKTLQSEVISLCGGKNIFADSPVPWPQVSREQVLTRKPQLIVIAGEQEKIKNVQTFWRGQLDIPVVTVPEDWFNRSGPRIIQAAEVICQKMSEISSVP
ncbi:vitamin B12 ABC transporter substrate-binding protein BtuF [Jinshanibacter sp. LJY008]|uniref:Vitamin B12-binding protein n=1 Tax=Limnobaculum eriocheiris TaxID=2897391 RepID=A0A9X1MW68_9GAMM|nr:vitamin B12 ABC transporter substrate-binding protein BtuF [Limnobaculum eriocheiris]MCD1126671.1 vitamin B12 ABC transporter substrate-binding protein BtuF [Limnobaculum eriocheiris]